MAKVTVTAITSGYAPIALLNANFEALADAIENTLSRDGTSPNTMEADIDMDSNRILNLPEPINASEAARLADVTAAIAGDTAANLISFTPAGNISATTVQGAIEELDTEKLAASAVSAFGLTLIDDADAAAARTTLDVPSNSEAVLKTLIAAKGDVVVGTANDTPAVLTVGANGKALAADSSQSSGLVYIDNPSRPNLLVNPNWQIDQINEGALYTADANELGPDGWSASLVGAGVFKVRTLADPDNAALKCLEITCTTADASIAASDTYRIFTAVEGYDAAGLKFGTASPESLTIQFKFKTSVTGVYGIAIQNSAANRRYIGIITVADTNENEYSLTLTADTSGTWLYTNGVGLYMSLTLAAGTDFHGVAGAWAAGAERTTSAQCNFMSNTANIAYLKRIQLIPGPLVQAYKPADIEKELAKAQRYYAKTFPQGTAVAQNAGVNGVVGIASLNPSVRVNFMWSFPRQMRASPTVVYYNPSVANAQARDSTAGADCSVTGNTAVGDSGVVVSTVGSGSSTQGNSILVHITANARLA